MDKPTKEEIKRLKTAKEKAMKDKKIIIKPATVQDYLELKEAYN